MRAEPLAKSRSVWEIIVGGLAAGALAGRVLRKNGNPFGYSSFQNNQE